MSMYGCVGGWNVADKVSRPDNEFAQSSSSAPGLSYMASQTSPGSDPAGELRLMMTLHWRLRGINRCRRPPTREIGFGFGFVSCSSRACDRTGEEKLWACERWGSEW